MKASSSSALPELLRIMARLRSPTGCPWDRQQNHRSLRLHAVEEVYELMDAIEADDDQEMVEELGDLLLQVVFHCQLARERHAFDFDTVIRRLCAKLIGRHPHVFGQARVRNVDAVWAQWDRIKASEKAGTRHARHSALDGIPRHLPALMRAEKLIKKARKSGLLPPVQSRTLKNHRQRSSLRKRRIASQLFRLVATAQSQGWSAETLLREEIRKTERVLRHREKTRGTA
jgi:MazG family protein